MPEKNQLNWLFAILAYQNGLVDKDTVVSALTHVFRHPKELVSTWLVQNSKLTSNDADLVERLVELHLQRSSGDTEKTLASLNAKQFADSLLPHATEKDVFATVATVLPTPQLRTGKASGSGSKQPGDSRYQIVRPHAEGGLGVVYAANDLELNRLIALKQMKAGTPLDEFTIQRFVVEAEITGGLEHPGIVPVYSFGVDEHQRPFYAMRLIQGESLKLAVERFYAQRKSDPSLPLDRDVQFRQLLDRFVSVCNTLAYAHSRGVIHRDIKPANIMLGPFGETLVVDWGLAKALESEQSAVETLPPNQEQLGKQLSSGSASSTIPGSPIGTPAYMSPEQAAGDINAIGPASDVYGLGATLYTILTGNPPLDCRSVEEAIAKVKAGDVKPIRKSNPHVPAALAAICHKALSLDPNKRYSTPLKLAADIERWLADEPVSAHHDSLPTRCWRTIRKHRTAASVIGALGLACLLGAIIVSVLLSSKNEQLAASNAEAVARLDQAMTSYDGYVSGLYEELQRGTDFTPDQVEFLLNKPREFYEQLSDEIAAKDKPSARERAWLALARYNLGVVYEMLGRPRDAQAQYDLSRNTFETLLAESPDTIGYLRGLSACYNNLATIYEALGEPDKALSLFDELEQVCEKLIVAEPNEAKHTLDLFDTLNNKSKALESAGKQRQAIDTLQLAIEKLAAAKLDGYQPDVLYRLAIGRMNLGVYQSSLEEFGPAEQDIKASIQAWKALNELSPQSPALLDGLASSQLGLARLQLLTGNGESAVGTLQEAETAYRQLAEKQTTVPQFRQRLATTLGLLSNAARNAGNLDVAEQSAQEAIKVTNDLSQLQPNVPEVTEQLGEAYHALGLVYVAKSDQTQAEQAYLKAAEARKSLVASSPQVGEYHYQYAATLLNLANAMARQGKFTEAIATYKESLTAAEKSTEISSESPEFKRVLAIAWYELSRSYLATEKFNQSIEATEAYLKLYGDDAEWLESAASTYAASARDAEQADEQQREAWKERAMKLLEEAGEKGGSESITAPEDENLKWLLEQK